MSKEFSSVKEAGDFTENLNGQDFEESTGVDITELPSRTVIDFVTDKEGFPDENNLGFWG